MKRARFLFVVGDTVKDATVEGHRISHQRWPGGEAEIAVRDEAGRPVRTFSLRRCDYIEVDHTGESADLGRTL